jgi:hypothetical protein
MRIAARCVRSKRGEDAPLPKVLPQSASIKTGLMALSCTIVDRRKPLLMAWTGRSARTAAFEQGFFFFPLSRVSAHDGEKKKASDGIGMCHARGRQDVPSAQTADLGEEHLSRIIETSVDGSRGHHRLTTSRGGERQSRLRQESSPLTMRRASADDSARLRAFCVPACYARPRMKITRWSLGDWWTERPSADYLYAKNHRSRRASVG